MIESYRKIGTSTILEIRNGCAPVRINISECGVAIQQGAHFTARTDPRGSRLSTIDDGTATPAAGFVEQLRRVITAPCRIEQLTLVAGRSEQMLEQQGESQTWNETELRLHLALARDDVPLRASIDLAGDSPEGFAIAPMRRLLEAFALPHARLGRLTIGPLLLGAGACAQLLPLIAQRSAALIASRPTRLLQDTHPTRTRDGRGNRVAFAPITGPERLERPPNVFRPSYRYPPFPAWFHVRAVGKPLDEPPGGELEAIAVTGLPVYEGHRIALPLLLENRRNRTCSSAVIALRPEEWLDRIVAVAEAAEWFPVAAGVWGSQMVIDGVEIRDQEI